MGPFKILVVDDFERFRQIICLTLQQRDEFQIIGQASNGLEAVRLAEALQPDLVLLDIGLPLLDGIEAGRQIRKLSPNSKILYLTHEPSSDVLEAALALGAQGCLHKSDLGSELFPAVDAVLQGRQFISSHLELYVAIDTRREHVKEVHRAPRITPGRDLGPQDVPTGTHLVRGEAGEWQPAGSPGVEFKHLYTDSTQQVATMLVRMSPGSLFPRHHHAGAEQCLVLEGDLHFGNLVLHAGDFQCVPADSIHSISHSERGCLLLVIASQKDKILP